MKTAERDVWTVSVCDRAAYEACDGLGKLEWRIIARDVDGDEMERVCASIDRAVLMVRLS